jgi:antirestriction protein ArdC
MFGTTARIHGRGGSTTEAQPQPHQADGDDPQGISFLKRFTVFKLRSPTVCWTAVVTAVRPVGEREIVPRAEALSRLLFGLRS